MGGQTGVAIANRGSQEAEVEFILQDRYATEQDRITQTIPAGGHLSRFAHELFPTLSLGFSGLMEIRSSVPVAPITLQLTINTRNELVLTTLPVSDLIRPSTASMVVFPEIAIGGGFETRFEFMSGETAQIQLDFHGTDGTGLVLPLGSETSSQFTFDFASGEGQRLFPGDTARVASIEVRDPVTNVPTSEVAVHAGNVVRPRILLLDSTGKARDDFDFTLISLDTTIATVDSAGQIEGQQQGFSTLTIEADGVVATATITVVDIESSVHSGFVTGVAQDLSGRVYLAATDEYTILVAEALTETPSVYAGIRLEPGFKNDVRLESQFLSPGYLVVEQTQGTLYVGDGHMIREVQSGTDGRIETLAGSTASGYADGDATVARFNDPKGVALDDRGYLWVVDQGNHAIRRIDLVTRTVEPIAGRPGAPGFADGQGADALFDSPTGIALEPETTSEQLAREFSGAPLPPVRVIVADTGNGVIRRVTETGEVETLRSGSASGISAGSGIRGSASVPTGVPLRFTSPTGVAVDAFGNIHVSEAALGQVQTILPRTGTVVASTEIATLSNPANLLITPDGSLLVASDDAVVEISISPPTFSSVNPTSVSEGDTMLIKGANFPPDTTVVLGELEVPDPTIRDTATISFLVPALPLGPVTLVVETRGGSDQAEILVISTPDPFPEVSIDGLADGTTLSGQVGVGVTASDNNAVDRVQLRLDGVNVETDTTAPYEFLLDTTTASNGTHELTAVARDNEGNQTTSVPVIVTVDNADDTAPTVSINSPENDANLSSIVIVEASAADDVAVRLVTFQLDGRNLGGDSTAPYSVGGTRPAPRTGPII